MAIQLEDRNQNHLSDWEASQLLLLPIDQRRLEDPVFNQYIREMYHFARTYNKRMVGILLERCAYQSHPILSKIAIITPDESGLNKRLSQMAKQALSSDYETFPFSWEAVAESLDTLTRIEQKALRPRAQASLFYDTTAQIWKIDKGRPEGLSVWHSPLEVKTETGDTLTVELHQVLDTYALVSHFEGDQSQSYNISIPPAAEEKIKVYIQDHGYHTELIKAVHELMSGYERIQWVEEPRVEGMVLHLEADRAWFAGAVNAFQPFARPIAMTAVDLPVQIATQLHQIIDWEWLLRWETNKTGKQPLDMTLMAKVDSEWQPWGHERIFVWEMEHANDRYDLALELKNTHDKDLYFAVFQMRDDIYINWINLGNQLLPAGETALIPLEMVYLLPHTIPYNWPVSGVNIRVLASEHAIELGAEQVPGIPVLSLPGADSVYITNRTLQIKDKDPRIQFDQLLSISLLNPEYNSTSADPLRAMLEDYNIQYFAKGIYLRTSTLDARYPLREQIEFDADSKTPLPAFYGRIYEPPIDVVLQNMSTYLPAKLRATGKPLLIGIGDTWLNHNESIDLVAQLADDFTTFSIPVQNFAHIRQAVEAIAALEAPDPLQYTFTANNMSNVGFSSSLEETTLPPGEKWLLLSPMGERVFNRSMAELLSGKPLDKENPFAAFSETFFRRMDDLEEEWRSLIGYLQELLPDFRIVIHSYAHFPVERDEGLYSELLATGLSAEQLRELLRFMLDYFEYRLLQELIEQESTALLPIQAEVDYTRWPTSFVPHDAFFKTYADLFKGKVLDGDFGHPSSWLKDKAAIAWAEALSLDQIAAWEQFIQYFPDSPHTEEAKRRRAALTNMLHIPGGSFDMGDVMGDMVSDDETVHRITLSDFYLGDSPVTFAEYDTFCEATEREKPSDYSWGRDQRPVINVSWYDAVEYCNWLSKQHSYTPFYEIDKTRKDPNNSSIYDELKWIVTPNWKANGYRLPTEAEWEYAAREGGKKVRFGNGKDIADPAEINFNASTDYKKPYSVVGEYRSKTVPVGSLNSPNALGLHDMSGNVWEW
ncbi:MAG TPA: SUMF1/EgtB/PvdO family nonheme iron enzyme, partial [Saprospiraceae bacterium]|nr:SUMF1/EgtB/PvdO family nonheme iron enzyme [Saprospiraceae bacterium]HMQ82719.1 SUMF1/EgtB/PvdO family nonheme iron enzyme [Saprospiraceae bacterium]